MTVEPTRYTFPVLSKPEPFQGRLTPTMALSEERQNAMDKRANQIMAVVLPLVETGGIGLGTYVLIYLVGISTLIDPATNLRAEGVGPRRATGISLIVVYCLLLLVFAATYLRLLQVIWTNPGFTPLGDPASEKRSASTRHFDRRDAYICDYQGWPLWCDECHNWKPDRTHHSKQLGRCVRRMDHFCPWAGGIISETTHKFFVQFLFYGTLYTGFTLVVLAYYLAERNRVLRSRPATWIVAIALAGLFFLFLFGMFLTTFYHLALNRTTLEMLQKDFVHYIAMRGNNQIYPPAGSDQATVVCITQRPSDRTFLVVQVEGSSGLWDAGPLANIKSIMGNNLWDWFIPLRMSPCLGHKDPAGEFPWGGRVLRIMDQYGAGTAYRRARRRSSSSRQT